MQTFKLSLLKVEYVQSSIIFLGVVKLLIQATQTFATADRYQHQLGLLRFKFSMTGKCWKAILWSGEISHDL
ncbi:hypothetical protein H5410_017184 [Solanum commersonii]|uniref:Uncharacterized protein n=1 Tax=Solanum commersonii TaxID=4109 RepID=A0A9J5ZYP9_SOLCO|nr:hypothetical protein H5410_017184 [Solanum commersonii]